MFFKIDSHKDSQYPQEIPVLESVFTKETPTQVFACKYCEIFRNSFFYRATPVGISDGPTTLQ